MAPNEGNLLRPNRTANRISKGDPECESAFSAAWQGHEKASSPHVDDIYALFHSKHACQDVAEFPGRLVDCYFFACCTI